MKRALVLAGGGSKGAYEVGFVKALYEKGISFDIITGTSIGALNGGLLAQGDFDKLQHLWDIMDVKEVFADGFQPDLQLDLDQLSNQSQLAITFVKKYIKEKGADITPLINHMKELLDIDKFMSSPIDFGLCSVQYPSLKPLLITKHEMEEEHILDYLIASASCFPLFPMHYIHHQAYIDGGFYDNLPIDLAFDMGADEVWVVDMRIEPIHPHYINRPHVIYTHPYIDLGNFMDFDKDIIKRNQMIGYYTAKKVLGDYMGCVYTFENFNTSLFDDFYKEVLSLERYTRKILRNDSANFIYSKFMESHHNQPLDKQDYLLIGLDWLGELLDLDTIEVYQFDTYMHKVYEQFDKYTKEDYQMLSFKNDNFSQIFENVNRKGIVGRLLHAMIYPDSEGSYVEKFLTLFSKEIVMAKLLYMFYKRFYGTFYCI